YFITGRLPPSSSLFPYTTLFRSNGETGRIFRTMPLNNLAKDFKGRYEDLNLLSDRELVDLQKSASDWHSRRARGILHKRAVNGTLTKDTEQGLLNIFDKDKNPDFRLRAMWTLHQIGGWSEQRLLDRSEEHTSELQSR